MLEVCNELFALWGDKEVRYCHWKSNEHLMEGLDGDTDLDVYVSLSDKDKAEKILKACRYIECVVQKGHRYPKVEEWIGFDEITGKLVHIHLHYQIITGTKYCKEYVFPLEEIIISTRIKDLKTGVYIINPNLEMIILFCRIALKSNNKNKILPNQEDVREIEFLRSRISKDNVRALCDQLMGTLGSTFSSLINKEQLTCKEWKTIYTLADKWLTPYRKYSKIEVFIKHNYYKTRFYIILGLNKLLNCRIVNKKTFNSKGISVCFLGQDGSGKSTLSITLCKWLNWKLEASRFYLGSGDHYHGILKSLLPKVSYLLHTSKSVDNKSKTNKLNVDEQTNPLKGSNIINVISHILNSISLRNIAYRAYKEVFKAERYKERRGIALFDRFPQNQFAALYDGPKVRYNYLRGVSNFWLRYLAKQEESYIDKAQQYQPDLIFKLVLPVEESMRRKPEENQLQVAKKAEITKQLVFDKSIVFVVDATQDFDKELLFIKRQIWNTLVVRNT